jgi:tRNA dimethylallyltransferase
MRQLKLGVLGEAEWLMEYAPNSTASQAIGYKEYFNYLRGLESLETAVKRLKRRTRELAKRQFTWFRKEPNFKWVNLSEVSYKTYLILLRKSWESENEQGFTFRRAYSCPRDFNQGSG